MVHCMCTRSRPKSPQPHEPSVISRPTELGLLLYMPRALANQPTAKQITALFSSCQRRTAYSAAAPAIPCPACTRSSQVRASMTAIARVRKKNITPRSRHSFNRVSVFLVGGYQAEGLNSAGSSKPLPTCRLIAAPVGKEGHQHIQAMVQTKPNIRVYSVSRKCQCKNNRRK